MQTPSSGTGRTLYRMRLFGTLGSQNTKRSVHPAERRRTQKMYREFLVLLRVFLSKFSGVGILTGDDIGSDDFSPILQVTKPLHDSKAFLQYFSSLIHRPSKRLMPIPPPSSVDSSAGNTASQGSPQNYVSNPCQSHFLPLSAPNSILRSFPNPELHTSSSYITHNLHPSHYSRLR